MGRHVGEVVHGGRCESDVRGSCLSQGMLDFSNLVKGKALGPSDLLGYGSTGDAREVKGIFGFSLGQTRDALAVGNQALGPSFMETQPLDCGSAVKLVQQGLSLADPLVQAKLQELMEWNSGVDEVLVAESSRFSPPSSIPSPTGSSSLGTTCTARAGTSMGSPGLGLEGWWT